jgi:hypothetical protein
MKEYHAVNIKGVKIEEEQLRSFIDTIECVANIYLNLPELIYFIDSNEKFLDNPKQKILAED